MGARAWHLYVVRTRDGALYTGVATDVDRRVAEHEASAGAKSLRARAPLEIVYRAKIGSRSLALRAELRVKRLSKRRKEALVARGPDTPSLLALLAIDRSDGTGDAALD